MPLFQNLRQSLGGYFSPARKELKRESRSPSLAEVKSQLDRETVTPSKRTSDWLKAHSGEIKTPKILSVKGSRVTKPTASRRQSAKATTNFWNRVLPGFLSKQGDEEIQDDVDGDTLLGEDPFGGTQDYQNETTIFDLDLAEPANPALNVAKEEDTYYTPTAEEREVMKTWSKDQVELFRRLNMRGFEPLLPSTWKIEFITLPEPVFSTKDPEILIKAHEGSDYNACRALQSLFNLGGHVRDAIACHLRPQDAIRRELLAYYKWSIMDANLHRTDHIPVLAIATAAPREPVASVVGRVTDSLHDLGRQYRAHFFSHIDPETKKTKFKRQLPTLYGVVITRMIVTFVTYDARIPGKPVQTMGIYDLQKLEQDVWHALAVGIVMCRARDYLVGLKKEQQVGEELEDGETDVDA